jgi:ABC-type dipeptide/oligopeptide/nickel transport system permease subunit
MSRDRIVPLLIAGLCVALLVGLAFIAPEHRSTPVPELAELGFLAHPPLGTDDRGRPLLELAAQGARVVLAPSFAAGLLTAAFAVIGGLVRAMGLSRLDPVLQGASEVVGALPRMVVILVVALVLPRDWRGLLPLALTWALLSAPGAMDEAAAVAERLGGARFVEALRAHGYSASRIFLFHVVALNLRPVLVRQGAEVAMQVIFLEIALSYLATSNQDPSFTHSDSVCSWADILYLGYRYLAFEEPFGHAAVAGLGLLALVAGTTFALARAARSR